MCKAIFSGNEFVLESRREKKREEGRQRGTKKEILTSVLFLEF